MDDHLVERRCGAMKIMLTMECSNEILFNQNNSLVDEICWAQPRLYTLNVVFQVWKVEKRGYFYVAQCFNKSGECIYESYIGGIVDNHQDIEVVYYKRVLMLKDEYIFMQSDESDYDMLP